jgi:archaemetzincin
MNHKEFGQTYDEYVRSGVINVESNRDVIYISPISFRQNESLDQGFITSLFLLCEAYFYGMKIKLMEVNLDYKGIEYRNIDENRIQINANQILEKLYKELPADGYCLIAFTDTDLYNDNRVIRPRNYIYKPPSEDITLLNNFCYGLSSIKNRIGILSFARYDPLFYIANPKLNDKEKLMKIYFILLKRACKVIVKETAHMFGLKNCTFFVCNMNGFNSMEEFDKRPLELCPVCLRKLFTNISNKSDKLDNSRVRNPFIIFGRFVKLKDTLQENFFGMFDNEVAWYNAKIESLRNEM